MEQPDEHDPDSTVWTAVGTLEKRAYTRKEIHDTLLNVAETLRPQNGFSR